MITTGYERFRMPPEGGRGAPPPPPPELPSIRRDEDEVRPRPVPFRISGFRKVDDGYEHSTCPERLVALPLHVPADGVEHEVDPFRRQRPHRIDELLPRVDDRRVPPPATPPAASHPGTMG